jgi:osmoprotectant transport system substrate-binding protein
VWDYITERHSQLLYQSYQHLSLVIQCVLLATVIAVGLAVVVHHNPRIATLAGALSAVGLTIPSFALLGSKSFQEQLILGKIAAILMRSAGAHVQDLTNMPGSDTSRQAMLQGQIQMAWEYTGTAWISYLGHDTGIPDKQQQYDAVRKEDAQKYGLIWLKPAPMNNSYGFAMTRKESERLHITKLSQVGSLPVKERTFCVESEFANRNDGFEPMLKHYGIPLGSGVPRNNIRTLDTGAVYAATDKGTAGSGRSSRPTGGSSRSTSSYCRTTSGTSRRTTWLR